MVVWLRKKVGYAALALGLVSGLFGGVMHIQAASPLQHATHSSQQQAVRIHPPCPPPPFDCG